MLIHTADKDCGVVRLFIPEIIDAALVRNRG
jgi:hypothetical protein